MFSTFTDKFTLANGVSMPMMGFGTWQIPNDLPLESAVGSAIQLGYRLFDTAQIYANATAIGNAIQNSGVSRQSFFLTSKIWASHSTYDGVLEMFPQLLGQLKVDYLDMLLVHWPNTQGEPMIWQSQNAGTWRALEKLYTEGRVRAIGVANFLPHHLVPLLARAKIAPMVNQLELHPGHAQLSTVNFCLNNRIAVQAWSPLGRGVLVKHPTIVELAREKNVTPSQICLRWSIQHGFMPIVRSLDLQHMKENKEIFHFELSEEEMTMLDDLPNNGYSGLHPDTVTF